MKNPNLAILFSVLVAAGVAAIMGSYSASEASLMVGGLATFTIVHLIQGLCFARYRSTLIPSVVTNQSPKPGHEYSIDHDAEIASTVTQTLAEQRFMDKDGTDPVPESKGRILIYQKMLEQVNRRKDKQAVYNESIMD